MLHRSNFSWSILILNSKKKKAKIGRSSGTFWWLQYSANEGPSIIRCWDIVHLLKGRRLSCSAASLVPAALRRLVQRQIKTKRNFKQHGPYITANGTRLRNAMAIIIQAAVSFGWERDRTTRVCKMIFINKFIHRHRSWKLHRPCHCSLENDFKGAHLHMCICVALRISNAQHPYRYCSMLWCCFMNNFTIRFSTFFPPFQHLLFKWV